MSEFQYNIPIDFSNGVNIKKLKTEIKKAIPDFNLRAQHYGDKLDIVFENTLGETGPTGPTELTPSNITQLNSIINSHDSSYDLLHNNFFPLVPNISSFSNTDSWNNIVRFEFSGQYKLGELTSISCLSKINNSSNSHYDIQLIDYDSYEVLASNTNNNNTDYMNIELSNISNPPIDKRMLEIQARIIGTPTKVDFSQIVIYYK